MPVFFICFIVFLLWLRVKLKQQDSMETQNKDFWQQEHEADFSRNKDISTLDYISVDKKLLPFNEQTDDIELIQIQQDINNVLSKKMINLSGMTNTEIKLAYGRGNFEILAVYDQNYLKFLSLLNKWGTYLLKIGFTNEAKQIFEYAVNTLNCDISGCYTGLAKIYLKNNDIDKVQQLIDKIQASDAYLKDSISEKLIHMLQNY